MKPLLSDEHFSVDGTLIEAWASQRSFRPKMAQRLVPGEYDQLHHFVAAGVWDAAPLEADFLFRRSGLSAVTTPYW